MKYSLYLLFIVLFAWKTVIPSTVHGVAYPYLVMHKTGYESLMPVIGFMDTHQVEGRQTLLEIARKHGLGYNQIISYHPEIDPWLPEKGIRIDIPTKWILPPTRHEEVVINIPEMRLYRFFKEHGIVRTYPIGIGREGFETPVVETLVKERIKSPSWTVPPRSYERFGRRVMPPGPENPLGDYWIGLSLSHIGIHGTNFPWGVGRRVSQGCIRMYPEHIDQFYKEAKPGIKVEIIYAPVKVGMRNGIVFLEVHPDIYNRFPDMASHAWKLIEDRGVGKAVDPGKVKNCVEDKKGVPTIVSRGF